MDDDLDRRLRAFLDRSRFAEIGSVVTDLDGTAVHEHDGRTVISRTVEHGLKHLVDLGRPYIINSLRFPLSVLRTFGRDWFRIADAPIPTVSLNGALIGHLVASGDGVVFEEAEAYPLSNVEIDAALRPVSALVEAGLRDVLVFYYPRDWRMGEIIWTPVPERVLPVREKYRSASAVTAVEFDKLRAQMHGEEVCMVFVLVDAPRDRLMAYQHADRRSFTTHAGVDKLSGALRMAEVIGVDLAHSVGSGDTVMDRFLEGAGLAVTVGDVRLPYRGLMDSVRVRDPAALG
ncbi:MAG: HAD family phosphatase, partial [Planctomycetes bacterium]|nr:HAD family phosphatase [Planctomycetota bacterium]